MNDNLKDLPKMGIAAMSILLMLICLSITAGAQGMWIEPPAAAIHRPPDAVGVAYAE